MRTEAAAKLFAALQAESRRGLCIRCASIAMTSDRYEVQKAIRELIQSGDALCGLLECASCGQTELIVWLRRAT